MKKNILLVLTIIFIILTFWGVAYVLKNHGTVSAGYAVVLWCLGLHLEDGFAKSKSNKVSRLFAFIKKSVVN